MNSDADTRLQLLHVLTATLIFLILALMLAFMRYLRHRNRLRKEAKPESDLLIDTLREQAILSQEAQRGRHQVQVAFSTLEELHKTVMAFLPVGVLVVDAQHALQYANPFSLRLFHLTGIEGKHLNEISPNLDRAFQQLSATCTPLGPSIPTRFHEGELLLEFSLGGLPDGAYLLTVVDVTQVSYLEERVRTKRDLELMGEMASGITHEVKNALATISGHAQMLVLGKSEQHAQEILDEVEQLLSFVKRFMQTSRGESLDLEPLDLSTWLAELAQNWQTNPHAGTVELVPPNQPMLIAADRTLLNTVLNNLILNGLQAQDGHGTVRLSAKETDTSFAVIVEDDGAGFAPEVRSRMFSPFVTAKRGGSGLGLFQSRKLLMEHQGRLEVVHGPPTQVICHFPKGLAPMSSAS